MTNISLNETNLPKRLNAGMRLRAVVKSACAEGVYVRLPGKLGTGTISPRSWGDKASRAQAIAQISRGSVFEVVVKSYDARTKAASLVLARPADKLPQNRKPAYCPLPLGSTLLVDTANLIGLIGTEQAAYKLEVISDTLSIRGYSSIFLWERTAFDWTMAQQATEAERAELAAFAERENVTLVGGEADLVLLQSAHEIAGSVLVTRDRLRDYAAVYPDLVGTDRHRAFSSVKLEGRMIVSIVGLKDAISIAERVLEPPREEAAAVQEVRPETPKRRGLLAAADHCLALGRAHEARALYCKSARKNPSALYDLADLYDGGNSAFADVRKAARYLKLANRCVKARRELRRRAQRQRAEHRRACFNGWLNAA